MRRNEESELQQAIEALQAAILHAGQLRLTLHDDLTELGKLHAALERCLAALRQAREKGGA